MKKVFSIPSVITIVILTIVLTFNTTYVLLNVKHNSELNKLKSGQGYFNKLLTVDEVIRTYYSGEINNEELMDSIIRGYLEGIGDDYSQYLTASEFDEYIKEMSGNTVGIGVNVLFDPLTGVIEIINVIPNSPALISGLKVGDYIVAIDGQRVLDVGYYKILELIKGEIGTEVVVTVKRESDEIQITCVRAEIEYLSVENHVYSGDPDIGVIEISSFNDETPKEVKSAVEELKALGCKKFIFDLRNNGGGDLQSILGTLDYLLPEGVLATVHYTGGQTQTFKSGASCLNAPVAVLVNGRTASAAELFAAALRDYTSDGKYDAVLVGTVTYGKGVFQSFFPLPDGSAFKFTRGRYDPPCGINYDGVGVIPDIQEDLSDEAKAIGFYKLTDENDNQLITAANRLSEK